MSHPRPPVCGESESWASELALGLLSGPDRASALSHLAGCPSCREQVDDLARVADRLLLLAPDDEPPAGFESRVLAAVGVAGDGAEARSGRRLGRSAAGLRRLGRRGTHRPRPHARAGAGPGGAGSPEGGRPHGSTKVVGLVAALMAAAAVAGVVVATVSRTDAGQDPVSLRTGLAVSSSGRTSCRVVVTGTRPASVLVSLDGYPGADTDVTVEMQTVSGETVPLGPLHVAGGHGLLVRELDLDAGSLRLMRMLTDEGRVVYEATLHDPPPPA